MTTLFSGAPAGRVTPRRTMYSEAVIAEAAKHALESMDGLTQAVAANHAPETTRALSTMLHWTGEVQRMRRANYEAGFAKLLTQWRRGLLTDNELESEHIALYAVACSLTTNPTD